MTQTESASGLSRKDRRSIGARAARLYNIKDRDDALAVYEAYQAVGQADAVTAARLVQPLIAKDVKSPHPYIILGRLACAERDGATAKAFFTHALEMDGKSAAALSGMGTALTLEADVFEAVRYFQQALELGHDDPAPIGLFKDLMRRMGRLRPAADTLLKLAKKSGSAAIYYDAADLYTEGEFFEEASDAFLMAHKKAPAPVQHRVGRVKAAMFQHDYDLVLREAPKLVEETKGGDVAVMLMNALRVAGRNQEAIDLLDGFDFDDLEHYQTALAVKSNICQDQGDDAGAMEAYEMALAMSDQNQDMVGKAYGSFRLRRGDFRDGADLYAKRHPAANRSKVPYENSASENLRQIQRAVLVGEQGIGDQLALIPQAVAALRTHGIEDISFVGDPRLIKALSDTSLPLRFIPDTEFNTASCQANEVMFIGDLVRHRDPATALAGYLSPAKRFDYREGERPVIGVSWKSKGTLSGHLRSVGLVDLLALLPENAIVVNLQYGDVKKEWESARRKFKKMSFVNDASVDQMTDMRSFLQQMASLDTVVSIDNTTAHAAGAIGHPDAHILIPSGSETMWYWGTEGRTDPWYGKLNLYRQDIGRDWASALKGMKEALSK